MGFPIPMMGGASLAQNASLLLVDADTSGFTQGYTLDGGNFTTFGNSDTTTRFTVAGLSATRVVASTTSGTFATLDYDGSDWNVTGNPKAVPFGGLLRLTALSATRVAVASAGSDEILAYDFDGTDWNLVGSALSISGLGNYPGIAALSATRVALASVKDGGTITAGLITYDFDGANWSKTGNTLALPSIGTPIGLCALTSTLVILADPGNDEIAAYEWDGADWAEVGTAVSLAGLTNGAGVAPISASQFVFIDGDDQDLKGYSFNGSVFAEVATALSVGPGVDNPQIASLSYTPAFTI